jgi:hypothetical protein
LPVPDEDVPIEKVLRFKEKRFAELAGFRIAMDGIYNDILKSDNLSLAYAAAKDKVTKYIYDVDRVMGEEKWARRLSTLESFINLPATASTAVLVGMLTESAEIGALAGIGAGTLLSMGRRTVQSRYARSGYDAQPFAYVHRVKNENYT